MTTLTDIDPAFAAMKELSALSPETVRSLHTMRQAAIYADGALPAKTKALAAMLWSIAVRCEPCVKYYTAEAKRLGASKVELGEMLGVASTMGGCVGETWALKALYAFNADPQNPSSQDGDACCIPPTHGKESA